MRSSILFVSFAAKLHGAYSLQVSVQERHACAEDYAKALEKDKQALKPRRKSHVTLSADSRRGSLSSGLPESAGLIPTARTAPTAAYQPYLDGAHLNSRPGTPAEASPSFTMQSGQLFLCTHALCLALGLSCKMTDLSCFPSQASNYGEH